MPAQGTPTPPLVGGFRQDRILENYIFQSGIHRPEHSSILTWKFPQFLITSLLDKLGASRGYGQSVFSWNVMGRTRKGGAIPDAVTIVGTPATVTATTDIPFSGAQSYLIPGDYLRFANGILARVVSIADDDGDAQVVLEKKGGLWAAGQLPAGIRFGHISSVFPEASDAPEGRVYLPTEEYNVMQILRRTISISGTEFTNRTYLCDGKSWYFTQEEIELKEFARDRELTSLFGVLTDSGTHKTTKGIWDYAVQYGVQNNTTGTNGAIVEDDIQEQIKDLMVRGCSNEIFVLAGADAMLDIQKAMKPYYVSGGVNFGGLDTAVFGANVQSYKFMGKMIHFAYYEVFEDDAVVPAPASASFGVNDFSKTTLWLDMGTFNGQRNIELAHKELDGINRKFIHGHEKGMVSRNGVGGEVASGKDAFSIYLLSEIATKVVRPDLLGVLGGGNA